MGVTYSGLRYPEPNEPVSAGALNIKNLASDSDNRLPQNLGSAPVIGASVGAGWIGWTSVYSLTPRAWPRVVLIKHYCYATILQAGCQVVSMVRKVENGVTTDIGRVQFGMTANIFSEVIIDIIGANSSVSYQGIAMKAGSCSSNATIPVDGRFVGVQIVSLGGRSGL